MYGTDGYRTIMDEIRAGDFYDPWALAMGWLYGLAEVLYVDTGEVLADFTPSPALRDRSDLEGDEHEMLCELLDTKLITYADMVDAYKVMSRYENWCRIAGRDY